MKISMDIEEAAILFIMMSVSAFMLIKSFEFNFQGAIFPQVTAGTTIFLGILIIFRNYLPGPLEALASSSSNPLGTEIEQDWEETSAETESEGGLYDVDEALFTTVSIAGYLVLSYLVGVLWATPIFVTWYTVWFQLKKWTIAALAILSFIIALLFMEILNLPLDTGYLTEVIL